MASTLKNPFGVYVTRCDGEHSLNEVSEFRFEQEAIPSWNDMKAVVKAQFDIENQIVLKYIDSDQEEITIGSQEEWLLALQAAEKDSNQLVLRFSVLAKEPKHTKEGKQNGKASKPPKPERSGGKCKKTHIASHLQNIHSKVDDLSKELSTVKLTQQQQLEEIKRHASSSSTPSSSLNRASVTHEGVLCSACRRVVHGARFKCANCADFNLCAVCEKSLPGPNHPRNHVFLKILTPLDHDVDAILTNQPVVAFDFYKRRSVVEFVRHGQRTRHRKRSSSSSSSSSGSSTSGSSSRSRRHRRGRRSAKRSHISSCSSSSRNCRHNRRPRRRRSSSSSGSTSTSASPSIVTVDVCGAASKRRRCSEACSASVCAFDRRRLHHSHCQKHHRHPHSHGHPHGHQHNHHWHRHGHHVHHHGHRKSQANSALAVDSQNRLMDWAVGGVETTSIGTDKDVDAENVMMSENEMSRFRNRLKQLACSPEESSLAADDTVELSEAPQKTGNEEYFVQTGCGLGEWVSVGGEASALPTSDFTLMEEAESVRQVESIPPDEPEVEVVGESSAPVPVICLDSEAEEIEEKKEEKEEDKKEEKEKEKEAPASVPLIDLDAEETVETSEPPAEETPQPKYPYPKADYSPVVMQQQQQQQWICQPPQYTPGVYPYPVATTVQCQPPNPAPVPVSTSAPAPVPPPAPTPTSEAAPPADSTPASAPPSSVPDPAPTYPYPSYQPGYPPLNGAAHAGLWNATVNAANGLVQALHGGWGGPTAATTTTTPSSNYSYTSEREMQQLLEMGFCNRELNRSLLQKHKNDVQAVVAELIGHTNDDWFASRH